MTREDVIRQIIERERQKQELDDETVSEHVPDLYAAGLLHFGTWETALRYCGINPRRTMVHSDYSMSDVLRRLRRLCLYGNRLSARQNMLRNRNLYDAARRHFGSWRRALIAIGLNLEFAGRWPKRKSQNTEYILNAIRARHEQGLSLVWSLVCFENRGLAQAAKAAFGSWRQALENAGFQSKRPTRWNRGRIVAELRLRHHAGKSVSHAAILNESGALAYAIRRYFGNWSEAIEEAGLSDPSAIILTTTTDTVLNLSPSGNCRQPL